MKFIKISNKDFEISVYQTTQIEWVREMGNNPSKFSGSNNPVENISFKDVQEFIKKINDHQDGYIYRLPTEEEWEYCCRAESTTDYCFGDDKKELEKYAWFYENSENKTHPVGEKLPNAWGLYDMHGNVLEWCDSFYYEDKQGSYRVLRGGGWGYGAQNLRSAYRGVIEPGYRNSYFGFRLVRTKITIDPLTLLQSSVNNKVKATSLELETTTHELMKLLRNKKLKIKIEVIE